MATLKTTLTNVLTGLPGDEFVRVGNELRQMRGTTVVATRDLSAEPHEFITGSVHTGPKEIKFIFEEVPMPVTKSIVSTSIGGTGIVRIRFSDGSERELAEGHADGVAIADNLDADIDLVERLLIAKAYRYTPDGTALSDCYGSQVSIDTNADTPILYTPSAEMT